MRFTVLASGSGGNASLIQVEGVGLLLDAGLGPRQLSSRMAVVGAKWTDVHAVLLTHTHGDHWKERTLSHLRRYRIPLYCHALHHAGLGEYSGEFTRLRKDQLVRDFSCEEELSFGPSFRCRALPLSHDEEGTFGFRFTGPTWSLGYLADLGTWTPALADALADVDILALEFNHDVEMEYASGRSPLLIARVLGDRGHLSNLQAAEFLAEVVRRSAPGRLRHLVQLHLSRECNSAELAAETAREVLAALGSRAEVHTACQVQTLATIRLDTPTVDTDLESSEPFLARQQFFPGWDY